VAAFVREQRAAFAAKLAARAAAAYLSLLPL
jgi:hypothetical protein